MKDHMKHIPRYHTNAFIDLNGVPYLLAEYLDRNNFQQVDRSLIKSEIFVDQTESMRAIIDISIDDIGKRASDGLPSIIGNNTKQKNLLKMITNNFEMMDHQFNVLRRGIVLRVNYQLENYRTGQVIRSMVEDLRITDRNYYLDINPRDINDNAIIVNFCNSMVSTINEFTHGRDRMMIRITNIQMFYECLKTSPKVPRIKQSLSYALYPDLYLPSVYGNEMDYYQYHDSMQHHHFIGNAYGYDYCDYGNEDVSMISPPSWSMFNRFYRFDHGGREIILHGQEINDPMAKVIFLPCGTVRVNRTFMINPGHRLIFKFCIWKNDLTVVNDTTMIAHTIKAPLIEDCYDNICDHNHGEHHCEHYHHKHEEDIINPDYDTIVRLLREGRRIDEKQNYVINTLVGIVRDLQDMISPPTEDPENPEDPDDPNNPDGDGSGDGPDNNEELPGGEDNKDENGENITVISPPNTNDIDSDSEDTGTKNN